MRSLIAIFYCPFPSGSTIRRKASGVKREVENKEEVGPQRTEGLTAERRW